MFASTNTVIIDVLALTFFVKASLREVSKYGVVSGLYFPEFGLNTKRYSEINPYLDIFDAVHRKVNF